MRLEGLAVLWGRLRVLSTACPAAINSITFAALASAWACCPQEVQANTLPQPGRDAGSRMPHAAHVWLVPAGRTSRSSDPKLAAL
jgi:hypothetical protein